MGYETRWEFIRPHVENKQVLDIGPAELVGTVNKEKLGRWIHRKISLVASHLVGLEKSAEQVMALNEMGYDILEGDAEQFELGKRFDVVVAGELIEHLSNPGMFLDCVSEHLVSNGKLVLTTPNRYSILASYRVLRTGRVPKYKKPMAKHVAYFDSDALTSLLERHGFVDIHIEYCKWVGDTSRILRDRWLGAFASKFRPVTLPVLVATAHKKSVR